MDAEESVEKTLQHHGVLGQKWGVTRSEKARLTRVANGGGSKLDRVRVVNNSTGIDLINSRKKSGTVSERLAKNSLAEIRTREKKKAAKVSKKADKKYEQSFQGAHGYVKVHNKIADNINPLLDELNSRPKYAGKDLTANKSLHTQYMNDYEKVVDRAVATTTQDLNTNTNGSTQLKVVRVGFGENATWKAEIISKKSASHDDLETTEFTFKPIFDSKGFVTSLEFTTDSITHGENFVNSLSHHGILGQRWGVRKSDSNLTRLERVAAGNGSRNDKKRVAKSTRVRDAVKSKGDLQKAAQIRADRIKSKAEPKAAQVKNTTKRGIKTTGGQNHPASEDATNAALGRRKAKASGTHSLSNKELQSVVQRMNLEQQYRNLSKNQAGPAKKFVRKLLGDQSGNFVNSLASNETQNAANKVKAKRKSN